MTKKVRSVRSLSFSDYWRLTAHAWLAAHRVGLARLRAS